MRSRPDDARLAGPDLCRSVRSAYGRDCYVIMLTAVSGDNDEKGGDGVRRRLSTSRWTATSSRCAWPSPICLRRLRLRAGEPTAKGVASGGMSTGTQDVELGADRVRSRTGSWERVAPEDVADAEAFVRRTTAAPAADLEGPRARRPLRRRARPPRIAAGRDRRRGADGAPRATTHASSSTAGSRRTRRSDAVSDDMPFLRDSVSMELSRRELRHPRARPPGGGRRVVHAHRGRPPGVRLRGARAGDRARARAGPRRCRRLARRCASTCTR